MVVVGGGGGYGIVRSGSTRRSALGLKEFLTAFQFICLAAPSRNHLKIYKH
jgi:hypothetical protein